MRIEEPQLKAFVLDSGLIPPDKMKKAEEEAQKTGKSLREILLAKEFIKEEELNRLQAYILGIQFFFFDEFFS